MRARLAQLHEWWSVRNRSLLPIIFSETAPLDLRIVGRMLFHSALVGVAAGLIGAAFFGGLEYLQRFLLEEWAGYIPLRAHGEAFDASERTHVFRPWLLLILPALGGLACGFITRFAPEARGGGGDAMIEAFHHKGGIIRRRVIWVKTLASFCTLGTGGVGGREGPTMQIGGALGSVVGRVLKVSARERRILLVAGVAAGISAVFRTPLGAALLAVEVLYRDGFESDALIPSVLASVVSYSVVISIFGESTLFAHAQRFPFVPAHLPYYGLLALLTGLVAAVFVSTLRRVQHLFRVLPLPQWLMPALGGLVLGVLCTPAIVAVGERIHVEGQGLGILGGGYGAVQMAISGSPWLPEGWHAVELLALLTLAKLVAASLTIGSGGSAGDFAPSLAIGGLFGGAFGRVVQLLTHDTRIDPGAFALVGMGVFYGGIAHVPLSALVLVCEMAGNYDLLVPLMLSLGIAFVALRKSALYTAQVPTQRDSPVHRPAPMLDLLKAMSVRDLMNFERVITSLLAPMTVDDMIGAAEQAPEQYLFPVVDAQNKLVGMVSRDALRVISKENKGDKQRHVADIMQPPIAVRPDDDLRKATEKIVANRLREIFVVDDAGCVTATLHEADVGKAYLEIAARADTELALNSTVALR